METIKTQSQDTTAAAPTGHYHTGKRLRKLLRPDGKRIHIAASPEEHLRLTRTLPDIEPDDNFEVHIHGSAEHVSRLGQSGHQTLTHTTQLDAVREIHAHHEQRRAHLRNKHGSAYEEFENVKHDLDSLADELHHLTDHSIAFDANFSKFGYDAHISKKTEQLDQN